MVSGDNLRRQSKDILGYVLLLAKFGGRAEFGNHVFHFVLVLPTNLPSSMKVTETPVSCVLAACALAQLVHGGYCCASGESSAGYVDRMCPNPNRVVRVEVKEQSRVPRTGKTRTKALRVRCQRLVYQLSLFHVLCHILTKGMPTAYCRAPSSATMLYIGGSIYPCTAGNL